MTVLTVPIAPAIKQVKIELRAALPAFLTLRFQLAAWIIRLAAWIAGTGVEIGVTSPERPIRAAYDRYGLPVRMSVGDVDFDPEQGARVEVSLDGVVQREVTAFDAEEGWVERTVRKDGKIVIKNGEVVRETLTGTVSVRWKDET